MGERITALWRRLDTPGHDACEFVQGPQGWALRGMAVFLEGGEVCRLAYEVETDPAFRTRSAHVAGMLGAREIHLRIHVDARGRWALNDVVQPAPEGCIDVDLGFTPATNFLPLRRLALTVGEAAQAPAAYLAFPALTLDRLSQRYARVSPASYEYEAPDVGYRGVLECAVEGLVLHYPGLFRLESG